MVMTLTPKQEAFCLAYIETGNGSDAYRKAGYANGASDKTVNEAASRLLKSSKVLARVTELQNKAAARNEITVDDLIAELEEARVAAFSANNPQTAAAVAATMGKAKLLGFLTDKVALTGANGGPVQNINMTSDEFKAIAKEISNEV